MHRVQCLTPSDEAGIPRISRRTELRQPGWPWRRGQSVWHPPIRTLSHVDGAKIFNGYAARKSPSGCSYGLTVYGTGYNETKASVAASLAQLQLDYIDLVMVHHRAADVADWPRTVNAMSAFPNNWARPGSPTNNGTHAQWLAPACAITDPTWVLCQDETWKALSELKAEGKLRAIGVSNWQVSGPNVTDC